MIEEVHNQMKGALQRYYDSYYKTKLLKFVFNSSDQYIYPNKWAVK